MKQGKEKGSAEHGLSTYILVGVWSVAMTLGGSVVLVMSSHAWWVHFESSLWDRAPAVIHHADMTMRRTSGGRRGRPMTPFKVTASYSYLYQGHVHFGNRVAVDPGSSLNDYAHEWHARLKEQESRRLTVDDLLRQQNSATLLRVYVNPRHPGEALIYRNATVVMYLMGPMGVLFTAVGVFFLLSIAGQGIRWRRARRLRDFSDHPWRLSRDWSRFIAPASVWWSLGSAWAGAIFTIAAVFLVWRRLLELPNTPMHLFLILGVISLGPLGMLSHALWLTARLLWYGRARLLLSEVPIVPGRAGEVVLVVPRGLDSVEELSLEIRCVRKVRGRSVGKFWWAQEVIHIEEVVIAGEARRTDAGFAIPLTFTIPPRRPARQDAEYPMHLWRLTAEAKRRMVRFRTMIELPVFTVKDSAMIEHNPRV